MREAEARWISEKLGEFPAEALSPMVEFGSSTRVFREVAKPHINECIHKPLRARGVRVITSDLKSGEGIEISGDIFDDKVMRQLQSHEPKSIMLCNILEHVIDRKKFTERCKELVPRGGYAIISVPRSYPYHLDPVDTLYRPDLAEVSKLFEGFELVTGEHLVDMSYWTELRSKLGRAAAVMHLLKIIAKAFLLRGGLEVTKSKLHRMLWLARPYEITIGVWRRIE